MKKGESDSSYNSSSDELEQISSGSESEHIDHQHECLAGVSEYDEDAKSFAELNDHEVDKYYERAKHHVEHL
jgi:hypothetical protein